MPPVRKRGVRGQHALEPGRGAPAPYDDARHLATGGNQWRVGGAHAAAKDHDVRRIDVGTLSQGRERPGMAQLGVVIQLSAGVQVLSPPPDLSTRSQSMLDCVIAA